MGNLNTANYPGGRDTFAFGFDSYQRLIIHGGSGYAHSGLSMCFHASCWYNPVSMCLCDKMGTSIKPGTSGRSRHVLLALVKVGIALWLVCLDQHLTRVYFQQ